MFIDVLFVVEQWKECKMNRKSVKSSNIVSVGYNEVDKILEVEFIRSGVYKYFDVPKNVYEAFITAPSIGKFLHSKIKGIYNFKKA